MLEILTDEYKKIHQKGSRGGIGPGCKLVITLSYWREYRGMRQMGLDYDVAHSTICDSIKWVEKTLLKSEKFQFGTIAEEIQKAKKLGIEVTSIIGDVEEQAIERPTENQEDYYSGKKKKHTQKNQIIMIEDCKRIINFFTSNGKVHDFQMLKNSGILETLEKLEIGGKFDSGYQGVKDYLSNAMIPYKKPRNGELTEEQKEYNTQLSKKRIYIEHVNRELKIFRIMKETYRNHRNRYEDKLTIMCAIYNLNNS